MTEEEKKVFLKKFDDFIDETRKNFSQVFEDREQDFKHFDKRTEDIYVLLGNLRNEAHIMTDKVERSTRVVASKAHETQEAVAGVVESVEEKLDTGMSNITDTLKGPHMFSFIKRTAKQEAPQSSPTTKKPGFLRRLWPFGKR